MNAEDRAKAFQELRDVPADFWANMPKMVSIPFHQLSGDKAKGAKMKIWIWSLIVLIGVAIGFITGFLTGKHYAPSRNRYALSKPIRMDTYTGRTWTLDSNRKGNGYVWLPVSDPTLQSDTRPHYVDVPPGFTLDPAP